MQDQRFLSNLLTKYGSPLYVYNSAILELRCADMLGFQRNLEEAIGKTVRMHYSPKANSNLAILEVVKQFGLNVDCMSPYELRMNEMCDFQPENILYVCNNIDVDEMELVYKKGILICLDSISQVETWGKRFPNSSIMVRINPGTSGVGHSEKVKTAGKLTKFGISEPNLSSLFYVAQKYNLRIVGTHQHLGSLFLDDKIPDYIAGVEAGLDIVDRYFKDIEIVDLGGGFGVPYEPGENPLNLDKVANALIPKLKNFISRNPSVREFKFEPGRYIPCEAGTLVGHVTAVKFENGIYWIGTDIGMNLIVRPSMYDSYHRIDVYSNGKQVRANFCGNVCESGDILGKDRSVLLPKEGDIVVVYNAGAYGFSMASNYTGRPRPAEVMVDENDDGSNSVRLIRERETIKDMMRNIVW